MKDFFIACAILNPIAIYSYIQFFNTIINMITNYRNIYNFIISLINKNTNSKLNYKEQLLYNYLKRNKFKNNQIEKVFNKIKKENK